MTITQLLLVRFSKFKNVLTAQNFHYKGSSRTTLKYDVCIICRPLEEQTTSLQLEFYRRHFMTTQTLHGWITEALQYNKQLNIVFYYVEYNDHQGLYFSVCAKRNAHLISPPRGGGRPKIHMVNYVNGSSIHAQFFFSVENLQPF